MDDEQPCSASIEEEGEEEEEEEEGVGEKRVANGWMRCMGSRATTAWEPSSFSPLSVAMSSLVHGEAMSRTLRINESEKGERGEGRGKRTEKSEERREREGERRKRRDQINQITQGRAKREERRETWSQL